MLEKNLWEQRFKQYLALIDEIYQQVTEEWKES